MHQRTLTYKLLDTPDRMLTVLWCLMNHHLVNPNKVLHKTTSVYQSVTIKNGNCSSTAEYHNQLTFAESAQHTILEFIHLLTEGRK